MKAQREADEEEREGERNFRESRAVIRLRSRVSKV